MEPAHSVAQRATGRPHAGDKNSGVSAAFPILMLSALRLRLGLETRVRVGTRARLAGGRHGGGARRARLQHRLAVGLLAVEQVLNLVAAQRLELEQALRECFEILAL